MPERKPLNNPATPALPIHHYENFPVASLLCPPALRTPIAAIYHFARTADDLADEGAASAQQRLDQLGAYRQALEQVQATAQCPTPSPLAPPDPRWEPVFAHLLRAVRSHRLPIPLLHALLDAFEQDVRKTRDHAGYANEAELLDYCSKSAHPVGRLLLHLYGIDEPLALARSDAICSALQLFNFWQDLRVDTQRGRCYLPDDDCQRFGVHLHDLTALRHTPQLAALLAHCVARARTLMHSGAALVHQVPGRAGWELRLVVQGGLRIGEKIAAQHYTTLERRPVLGLGDWVLMVWRALRM